MNFANRIKRTERYYFITPSIQSINCPFVNKAQSDLILPSPIPLPSFLSLTQEITGFFIIEWHVLQTTGTFRSESEVEELWDALVARLSAGLQWALKNETDPNEFLKVKECLIGFIMTLEVSTTLLGQLEIVKELICSLPPSRIHIRRVRCIHLYYYYSRSMPFSSRSSSVGDSMR
jgi:hypothetical protein